MHLWENWRRSLPSRWVLFGVATVITAGLLFVVISIYDFLAVNNPVGEGILVVEAWIPAQALTESLNVFNSGRYSYLVVVGGPIQGSGPESNPATYDDLAAKRLEKLGFDTKKLIEITVPGVSTGHTLASATAVKRWLVNSRNSECCVDVFTVGVHARRSWILFRYTLGDRYRVGIISGTEVSYNPRFWFFSRTGIWKVVHNLVGYVYYKLFILFNAEISSR
jgi:hypothetical protein